MLPSISVAKQGLRVAGSSWHRPIGSCVLDRQRISEAYRRKGCREMVVMLFEACLQSFTVQRALAKHASVAL